MGNGHGAHDIPEYAEETVGPPRLHMQSGPQRVCNEKEMNKIV